MEILSATYNKDSNGEPISVRIVTDESQGGMNRDVPLGMQGEMGQALQEWLAADPVNNKIDG